MNKTCHATQEKGIRGAPIQERQKDKDLLRRLRQLSVDLWIWEVVSLLLSACCVGAIIVILLRYDNKPLPAWNYGLTINGVISVLAVVAKAAMILPIAEGISQLKWNWYWKYSRPVMDFQFFDAASRGPWGCLMLLLLRPKQWSIASIGALLTVLALLMEPSLQLIPSNSDGLAEVGTSLLPRSTYYKDYKAYYGPGGDFSSSEFNLERIAREQCGNPAPRLIHCRSWYKESILQCDVHLREQPEHGANTNMFDWKLYLAVIPIACGMQYMFECNLCYEVQWQTWR
jgi:hypothetical protein